MVKQASAGLDAHIQGEGTTLATLWRVTRRDGVKFHFTDHDRGVVINVDDPADTANADTYEASTGFTRTTITNTSTLSVDSMDVESLLDSAGITERDVRAGLWDYAQIEVFTVNWADTVVGVLPSVTVTSSILSTGAPSSSLMVPWPSPSPMVALPALPRSTK